MAYQAGRAAVPAAPTVTRGFGVPDPKRPVLGIPRASAPAPRVPAVAPKLPINQYASRRLGR